MFAHTGLSLGDNDTDGDDAVWQVVSISRCLDDADTKWVAKMRDSTTTRSYTRSVLQPLIAQAQNNCSDYGTRVACAFERGTVFGIVVGHNDGGDAAGPRRRLVSGRWPFFYC